MIFNRDVLKIDPAHELEKLSKFIVEQINVVFRRKGAVIGLSGGIDSACIAAVAVHAIGKDKVVGLVLPEAETNPISSEYAIKHAQALGIEHHQVNITASLPVSDQEFFFRISFDILDHLLYAWEHKVAANDAAKALDISEDAVKRAYKDFDSKNRATAHLREGTHTLD